MLLDWLEETVSDLRHHLLFLNLFQLERDFLTECHTMLSLAHELLDLSNVFL